jgi:hypothetical protein
MGKSILTAFLLTGTTMVSSLGACEDLYAELIGAGGSLKARDIAIQIARDYKPDALATSEERLRVAEKLYAAKRFEESALWMLSGIIDKACRNSIAQSDVRADLEEIGLNLDELKSDASKLATFQSKLGDYWKTQYDSLEAKLRGPSTSAHMTKHVEPLSPHDAMSLTVF